MKTSSDEMNALLYGDDEPQIDRGAAMLAMAFVAFYGVVVGFGLAWLVL